MGDNLALVLRNGYRSRLDRTFLRRPGRAPMSYEALEDRASRFVTAMRAAGVETGDRVVVHAPKSFDAVALYVGCLRLGAVYVPLNTASTESEIGFFVRDAEPALVVRATNAEWTLDADDTGTLSLAADASDPDPSIAEVTGNSAAAILYTSGTTGRSKGAMLTHDALASNAQALHRVWGWSSSDVLLHTLPIFHVHGLFVALHLAMSSGSEVRFCPRFDVDMVIESLPSATVMMGVPTHYMRLLGDPRLDRDLCASMRLFTSGSAPLSAATHRAFAEATGHRILERYGMSEVGIITSNPLDGERIAGTVGSSLPGVEVRIRRADGSGAEHGEVGDVETRGPTRFAGYWRLPDRTAEVLDEGGWFRTGDLGSLDATGRLTLEGRAGDMIISGGENVYPVEIEALLDDQPSIVESAVVGLPHPDLGEAVTAFVVCTGDGLDEPALQRSLDAALARFKHPKTFQVVDVLPRNALAKIQKAHLRRTHATLYTNR